MTETFFGLEHPNPYLDQYGKTRRGGHQPSGTIVIHTAENIADLIGADLSAENVAGFIASRRDYGSYHRIVDSDSILRNMPFGYEAWHCRFTNPWSIGLSCALEAGKWAQYAAEYVADVLRNLARAAAEAIRDLKKYWNVTVPLRRLTRSEALAKKPGFIGHGDTDPTRRSDPGDDFDWQRFFAMVRAELAGDGAESVPTPTPPKTKPVAKRRPRRPRTIRRGSKGYPVRLWQDILVADGYDIGPAGVDNDFGPRTTAATRRWQADRDLVPDGVVGPITWTRALLSDADGRLREGDRGPHVELLQLMVRVKRDRRFGPVTKRATQGVQRWLGLKPDAMPGPNTVRALVARWT